jgi:hypothetical protein
VPVFLLLQDLNNSESKRLQQLEWKMVPMSKSYIAAATNALIGIPKYSLDQNAAELRSVAAMQQRHSKEYAVAITVSSVIIIIFRRLKPESRTAQ